MTPSLPRLLVFIVLCVAALVGYRVWYSTVAASSVAAARVQEAIGARETSPSDLSNKTSLAQLTDDEAAVQGYFVPEDQAPWFIDDIEGRGRGLGTTVTVSSVAKTGTDVETQLAVSLVVRGPFDAVMRTVGAVEYAPRDVVVTSLVLVQETKNAWRADLRIVVGAAPPSKVKTP